MIFDNKISISSIMGLIHDGKIASICFNRKYFIPKYVVDELIAKANGQSAING